MLKNKYLYRVALVSKVAGRIAAQHQTTITTRAIVERQMLAEPHTKGDPP
jgi:hypothetical protein